MSLNAICGYATKALQYGKRVAKVAPDLILGTGTEVAGAQFKLTKGSWTQKGKAGLEAVEKMSQKSNFVERTIKSLKLIPAKMQQGIRIAKAKNTSTFLGGAKGLMKGLGKNMPLLFAAPMVIMELPNIIRATLDEGLGQGVAEVFKAGSRLTGGAIAAVIGTACIPVPLVGTLVGWLAGEWLTSKIVGKSYTDRKQENEQKIQNAVMAQQYANPFHSGSPYLAGMPVDSDMFVRQRMQ